MEQPPFTTIATEVADRVLTITLDRPDRLNAFTVTMQRSSARRSTCADADPEVQAVVVTGRGRGFCAGADLESGGDDLRRHGWQRGHRRRGRGPAPPAP